MAMRRSWFGWIKRLFICEAKAKAEKSRRLRWVFRRLKLRHQISTKVQETRTLNQATEDQRKHAMNVAIATAAAAEAAVAAAKAAAEVVRMAGNAFTSQHFVKKHDLSVSAIKIQSAFRAYLARKALRALKSLVRLQAIVRGRAVRRKVSSLLKSTPSRKASSITRDDIEGKHWSKIKEVLKVECNGQNGWDSSALTKEDIKSIWLRKQEGVVKRERMLKYSRSHRERRSPHMLLESLHTKDNRMRSCRLEHWGESKSLIPGEIQVPTKLKLVRTLQRQDSGDVQESPFSFPRRSFSRLEQSLLEDESCYQSSRGFQPYMSVTESAKEKFRSLSTPRQRVGVMDSWLDKKDGEKVSLWSSFVSETSKMSSSKKSSLAHS
ncbi:protein IQ-DOMAIN 12-like isoform X2 [Raphanus sativus]|uniref:Protein IQ-DOMAIN 12-like isoform X2 n=1 Tax=Raphanus sativus TaxID=3726 RepID=A0A9W3CHS5_RAPSA|nr:protein IQ-DOMAIN 12-like isoform X2 [Raphanus sativus]